MPYHERESDGLNIKQLINETGGDPSPGLQSSIIRNIVKALWNLKRLIDVLSSSGGQTVNKQTGTAYTLAESDAENIVEMNNAAPNVVTVPLGWTGACDIVQTGAGVTTLRGAVGVTINGNTEAGGNESDVVCQGQYKGLSMYESDTNEIVALGGV